MPSMLRQGAVIHNRFNGETFIFSGPLEDPQVARFDVTLEQGGTGGGNAFLHVHPRADERFAVRSGRLMVMLDGKEHHLEAGEDILVPRGRPHFFANASGGTTEMTVELRPAQQHVRFFANFASLAQNRPGWFSPTGMPHLLLMALVLHRYPDHLYGARLPVRLQKLLFAVLAPLARLRGYALEVEPRPRA
jgi:mannose-6-phosphate isomerase-like protein (cupin superfamily)